MALEFWAMIQEDPKAAWKKYMAYTSQGGSRVFTELLKNAGLDSPFDESCLRGVCEKAGRWLQDYDLTGSGKKAPAGRIWMIITVPPAASTFIQARFTSSRPEKNPG